MLAACVAAGRTTPDRILSVPLPQTQCAKIQPDAELRKFHAWIKFCGQLTVGDLQMK